MTASPQSDDGAPSAPTRSQEWSGPVEDVLQYHRLSSLDPERSAAMPEEMEWRHQPVPFRRYEGVPQVFLPLTDEEDAGFEKEAGALKLHSPEWIGHLLEHSLALAGWKRSGRAAFGLRVTPSAGNLHPLESYVLTPTLEAEEKRLAEEKGPRGSEGPAALYHYSPFDHALELRRRLPDAIWSSLRAACPEAELFVGLSLIYWRCAWKYGERAFRLSHLDAGHAVAALDAAASLLGYRVRYVDTAGADLRRLLGLAEPIRQESEDAACLLALEPVHPRPKARATSQEIWDPPLEARKALAASSPQGVPSGLDTPHRFWPGILSVACASHQKRHLTRAGQTVIPAADGKGKGSEGWDAQVLRARRSRSRYEDRSLLRNVFNRLMDRLVGQGAMASAMPWRHDLAVVLFVHQVEGLDSGLLTALPTDDPDVALRGALRPELEWRLETSEIEGLHLWRLASGDSRRAATHLAGGQSAAGESAFTALFLARFRPLLEEQGGFAYRRVHWQAGELGHRLYLAAEEEGLGATGLAGFYDGQLCTVLGLQDEAWRPLYMCAVGHRCGDDAALQAPYAHRSLGAVPLPASAGGMRFNDGP